jgi:hypothetical protein
MRARILSLAKSAPSAWPSALIAAPASAAWIGSFTSAPALAILSMILFSFSSSVAAVNGFTT